MQQKQKSLHDLLTERDELFEELEFLEDKIEVTRKREWSEKFGINIGEKLFFVSRSRRGVTGILKSIEYNHLTDGWIIFVTPYLHSGKLGSRAVRVYPNEQTTITKEIL